MKRYGLSLILQAACLVVPINIFVIGDWIGAGLQWALFRFQDTAYDTSTIGIPDELSYIARGIITGNSAFSIVVWLIGALLLVLSFLLVIQAYHSQSGRYLRMAGIATIIAGILFIVSSMLQYGVTFSGPSGISLPLGVPLIVVIGYLSWCGRLGLIEFSEEDMDRISPEDPTSDND
jgi:hypothetical protein